jgi:hypothetical protein
MANLGERSAILKALTSLDGGGVKEGDILYEVGNAAFDGAYTDTLSRPVVTKLSEIIAGFATPFDSYAPATDANIGSQYCLFVRPDVTADTDSLSKTFSIFRSSVTPVDGLKFSYIVFGRIRDTQS